MILTFLLVNHDFLFSSSAHDSDYTSDYNSDIDEEEAIFNRISNY